MNQYDISFTVNQASSGVSFIEKSLNLPKGALLAGTSTFPVAVGPGTNGYVLQADPAQAAGMKWADPIVLTNYFGKLSFVWTQSGTKAPDMYVLQNDFGVDFIMTRQSTGVYQLMDELETFTFNIGSTLVHLPNIRVANGSAVDVDVLYRPTTSVFALQFEVRRADTRALVDLNVSTSIQIPVEVLVQSLP